MTRKPESLYAMFIKVMMHEYWLKFSDATYAWQTVKHSLTERDREDKQIALEKLVARSVRHCRKEGCKNVRKSPERMIRCGECASRDFSPRKWEWVGM